MCSSHIFDWNAQTPLCDEAMITPPEEIGVVLDIVVVDILCWI